MNKTNAVQQTKTASSLSPAQGLLQRKCACGNHTVAGGECSECAKNKGGVQRKLSIGASNDPLELEADRVADQVLAASAHSGVSGAPPRIQRYAGQAAEGSDTVPASVDRVVASSGSPLEPALRQDMEHRFGHDFSRVRVHFGGAAEKSAQDVNAKAYTVGHNIVFGAGQFALGTHGRQRWLLAHELTHVVQQSEGSATGSIQRYEAGEHAQFGETGTELKALINAPASTYVVKSGGETLAFIAAAFGVPQDDLLQRNKDKIKQVPVPGKKGVKKKTVAGFAAGERIEIPQVLNQPMRDALAVNELSYDAGTADDATGKRAKVMYGEGIAMGGDLFGDPGQIDAAPKDKIEKLQTLIQGEKTSAKTGKFVATADWEMATDHRFAELALKNESHFAPSDSSLVTPATSSATAPNHKTEWERYHTDALHSSQGGDKDKALQVNSFADHFLTDAFSAGHLFNKLDVMEKFKGGIKTTIPDLKKPMEKEIAKGSISFFDEVAKQSFVGPVKTLFSQYETAETKYGLHWRIDSADMFSRVLQGVYLKKPDQVASGVAKAVHDDLDTKSGGISVENQKGDKWQLSGDKTLNAATTDPKTLEIGRKAVAQSLYNILSVFNAGLVIVLDLLKLFKAVWDFVPRPTSASVLAIKATVDEGTDPTKATLVSKLAKLVREEYPVIHAKILGETPPLLRKKK